MLSTLFICYRRYWDCSECVEKSEDSIKPTYLGVAYVKILLHWFDNDCHDLPINESDQRSDDKNKHYEPGIPPRRVGREIVIDEGNPCV